MAQINLTFSLLTLQHRQLRWSRSPLGPGANNDTPPWVILRLIPHSQTAAWVHDMGTSKKACLIHTFRGRTLQSGENLISRWMDGYKERQGTERNLYWPLNDPNENRVECRVEGLFFVFFLVLRQGCEVPSRASIIAVLLLPASWPTVNSENDCGWCRTARVSALQRPRQQDSRLSPWPWP